MGRCGWNGKHRDPNWLELLLRNNQNLIFDIMLALGIAGLAMLLLGVYGILSWKG